MNIYLDDNRAERGLAALLKKARHTVILPSDIGVAGVSDARHLTAAITNDLAILTADRDDFQDLHDLVLASGGSHPGVLIIRYDNDTSKDMRPRHIVAAIGNLEKAGVAIKDQYVVLNQWR